jgi:predicted outer membrane repeat protein
MASAGDTVLVATGAYTTQETREIDIGGPVTFTANVFMRDQVHLMAGPGDPLPLIDAGGTGVCIVADQVGAGTILDGFQIQNGNANGSGFNSVGGGMLCLASDLTIRSNTFTSNQAGAQGGGLACEEGSSPRIDNNLFDSNQAGTDGGAILCLGGAATIVGNIFSMNTTGDVGAAVRYVASGEISDNVFRDNQNLSGANGAIAMRGGTAQGPNVTLVRNIFHDNTSAIFMRTAPATLISQNTIIRCGAGIIDLGTADDVTVTNNVIVSNDGPGLSFSGNPPALTCNDVWQNVPNYDGIPDPTGNLGNISVDPLHCDPAQDDFTLHENSLCSAANSGACGLIGTFDSACPPSSVEPTTWGRIKTSYRR